ncbi:hypothetical protein GGR57DRAFT_432795 [Xylariaceae sp. FL1272]|nr:hypothetical protein GGR57DRAFT_432795 [Xylariaceae sp. FL1272]
MACLQYLAYFGAIALLARLSTGESYPFEYCADFNTASSAANFSIYQSQGLCHDFCNDQSFAYAVLNERNCWCSNYTPDDSTTTDISDCDTECAGYPTDLCGGDGLWGYIELGPAASGTLGADTTSTSTAESTTSSAVTSTTTVESTVSSTTTTTSSSIPDTTSTTSTTAATSKTSTTSTTSTSTTKTATPQTSVQTITVGGSPSVQTITFTPSSSTTPDGSNGGVTSSQKGLSGGAAAGVAIGVLAIVGLIASIIVFFCIRKRKQRQEEELASNPASHRGSSAGMMGTPTTGMASVWDGENASTGRRSSRLMPHDPRMDPYAMNIYTRFENKSRESINTLQDNQDYSRKVLRTTNPDPPEQ